MNKPVDRIKPCEGCRYEILGHELFKNEIHEIADYYGYETQGGMMVEECAELIQAVNKYSRDHSADNVRQISEEIADVEIMLSQIKYLLSIDKDAIEDVKRGKLNRQIERITYERLSTD